MASIYEIIDNAVVDGRLPKNFRLPVETEEQGKYPDGAQDTLAIFHTQCPPVSEENLALLSEAIRLGAQEQYEQGIVKIVELGRRIKAVYMMDAIGQYIHEHSMEMNPEKLFYFGGQLILLGLDRESVKYGLCLLESFDCESNPGVRDIILELALCDEFTLFTRFIIQNWQNSNQVLFELAKKVNGWGRIHLILMIEPTSEEIRDWMMTQALYFNGNREYAAIVCLKKSGAEEEICDATLSMEHFRGICDIFCVLTAVKSNMPGYEAMKRGPILMEHLMDRAAERTLEMRDFDALFTIRNNMEERGETHFVERLDVILNSEECKNALCDVLFRYAEIEDEKFARYMKLAQFVGLR